jgi:hypothetical protein
MKRADEYKVVRLLDEMLPGALKPTPSGARLDCRIYFREDSKDGHLWGEVVLVDADTGRPLNDAASSLPLDSPEALKWYLGVMAEKAYPLAIERRTKPKL